MLHAPPPDPGLGRGGVAGFSYLLVTNKGPIILQIITLLLSKLPLL